VTKNEDWDLYVTLAQYFFTVMSRPMLQGKFFTTYFIDFTLLSLFDLDESFDFSKLLCRILKISISIRKNLSDATFHMIHTGFYRDKSSDGINKRKMERHLLTIFQKGLEDSWNIS